MAHSARHHDPIDEPHDDESASSVVPCRRESMVQSVRTGRYERHEECDEEVASRLIIRELLRLDLFSVRREANEHTIDGQQRETRRDRRI
jgi:hypothetical protein